MNLFDWLAEMPLIYQMVFLPVVGLTGLLILTSSVRRLLKKKIKIGNMVMTDEKRKQSDRRTN